MPILFLTWIVTRRPHDAAMTVTCIVDHISASAVDLKLKLHMWVEYGLSEWTAASEAASSCTDDPVMKEPCL